MEKDYNVELAPIPMKESVFHLIVFNAIEQMEDEDGEYLTIGYTPERDDGIRAIQTTMYGNLYRVEIIINLYDKQSFHIFVLNNQNMSKTLDLFHNVCVDFKTPNLDDWNDETFKVEYEGCKNVKDVYSLICGK